MPPSAVMNDEHLSPELALVDEELAADARSTLPADDTLARIELLVRAHRIAVSRAPAPIHAAPPPEEPAPLARAAPPLAPAAPPRVPAAPPLAPAALAPAAPPLAAAAPPRAPAAPPRAPAALAPAAQVAEPASVVEPASVAEPAPGVSRRLAGHRRSAVVAGTLAAAALASATLVGVRIDLDGQPAGADSSSIGEPPVAPPRTGTSPRKPASTAPTKPAARQHRSSPRPAAKPRVTSQPRRFVWAPVPGASGYHVQFFSGSTVVFEARTQKAEVTVPPSWTIAGVRRSLVPGTYRWNVWPVTASGQQAKAVVQAELVVP